MVAERLSNYHNVTLQNIEALKTKPWVKNELSKFGDLELIMKLYVKKKENRLTNIRQNSKKPDMHEETSSNNK